MITAIIPKLPAIDLNETAQYYQKHFQTSIIGLYEDYLLIKFNDDLELHFYLNRNLDVKTNPGMVYVRVSANIEVLYDQLTESGATFPKLGSLKKKPWGLQEFSIIDPNHNLLTFGQRF
ncbi:MAG: VOC family protein [Sphingobacteriales bacterium]|nr:MAG: VOC family protein [Sphingobacteriales bacterium]